MNEKFILLHPLNISSKIITNSKKAIMPECIYLKESENHIESRNCSFLFFHKRSLKSFGFLFNK